MPNGVHLKSHRWSVPLARQNPSRVVKQHVVVVCAQIRKSHVPVPEEGEEERAEAVGNSCGTAPPPPVAVGGDRSPIAEGNCCCC